MDGLSEIVAYAFLPLTFVLIGIARGRIPPPGPAVFQTAFVVCAVVVELAGSETVSLVGVVLVVGAVGTHRFMGSRRERFSRFGWWLVRGATGACLVLGLLGPLVGFPKLLDRPELPGDPLTDATLKQVRVGMSRDQVQAMIGPPRDTWNGSHPSIYAFHYRQRGYESWIGDTSELLVLFDGRDRVAGVQLAPSMCISPPSWAKRICTRLGR